VALEDFCSLYGSPAHLFSMNMISALAYTPTRVLEFLLLLMDVAALLLLRSSWAPAARWRRVLTAFAAITLFSQIGIEGYRWQLVPAYVLTGVLVVAWILTSQRSILTSWIEGWTGWTLLILATVLVIVVPTCEVPKPTGPFAVGTVVRHLVDPNRTETLADTHGPRELMIQIWYPAERPGTSKPAIPSADTATRPANSLAAFSLPCHCFATVGAPISAARASYPVVIYSPSWHGQRDQNTFQTEELASYGFVVVGIDHPYGSRVTVFPDGRIAYAELVEFEVLSSEASLQASIRYIERQLAVRVEDVEFVARELKQFAKPGSGDPFSDRLDLNRLGIFGYSFGGAVAAQACFIDPDFKAGMNVDGSMWGDVAEAGVSQPFLFMTETLEPPPPDKLTARAPEKRRNAALELRDYRQQRHSVEAHGNYLIAVDGTGHVNFEAPPTSPTLRYYLLDSGRLDAQRTMAIVRAYVVAFFQKHLNGANEPILSGPSASYPEVRFSSLPNREP
jgi:dienelactone hydrolase